MLKLYSYFRSSTSFRIRIALHLKGLPFEYIPVHLLEDGGQQYKEAYLQKNPMGEVPTLVVTDEAGQEIASLAQSVAILEYLEETYPVPPLLPKTALEKAKVRQIVEIVNSSIHPVQNLKTMKALTTRFGASKEQTEAWCAHWIERGFVGLEAIVAKTAGQYAFGDQITFADIAVVPQVLNAHRFQVPMAPFPTLERVSKAALSLEPFQKALPAAQIDAA